MIGLFSFLVLVPHAEEQIFEIVYVMFDVEQWAGDATVPHLCPHCFQTAKIDMKRKWYHSSNNKAKQVKHDLTIQGLIRA